MCLPLPFRVRAATLVLLLASMPAAWASDTEAFFFPPPIQAPGLLLGASPAANGPAVKNGKAPESPAPPTAASQAPGVRPRVSVMAAIGASMPSLANSRGFISVARTIFGQAEDAPLVEARVADKSPLQASDSVTVLRSREVDLGTSFAIGHPGAFQLTVANRTRMFADSLVQIRQSKGFEDVAVLQVGF